MSNPLIAKLAHGASLTEADRALLAEVCARTRQVGPRQDLIREGERPGDVHLVLHGFACRYKLLANGRRHNMALRVPGDFCDLHVAVLGEMDHGIATLSACTMVEIPRPTVLALTDHPRIARALWWATLVDEAVLREWLVNIGQREADRRMAHLFCELQVRLQTVGLADETGYGLPLTQDDVADLQGITAVHVNRTLMELRASDLLQLRGKRLTIPDLARLRAFAGFTPNYLHLAPRTDGTSTAPSAQG